MIPSSGKRIQIPDAMDQQFGKTSWAFDFITQDGKEPRDCFFLQKYYPHHDFTIDSPNVPSFSAHNKRIELLRTFDFQSANEIKPVVPCMSIEPRGYWKLNLKDTEDPMFDALAIWGIKMLSNKRVASGNRQFELLNDTKAIRIDFQTSGRSKGSTICEYCTQDGAMDIVLRGKVDLFGVICGRKIIELRTQ